MRDVHTYAIVSGFLFGIWPLFMNRSGLEGFSSAVVFTLVAVVTVVPVAYASGKIQSVSFTPLLWFAIVAGICGGLGVLFFNTALSKVTPKEVGVIFMIMMMIQLAVPALYHVYQTGDYSPKRIGGIIGAFVVAYMLSS